MVKLNKSTRYALYAMVELSYDREQVVSAGEIAQKYKISEHHVAKVLQQLARARLIRSIRGIKGGFQLAVDPKKVTMLDVIEVFEPQVPRSGCTLIDGEGGCLADEVCAIGQVFNEIEEQAFYTLKSVTIATLVSPRKISPS